MKTLKTELRNYIYRLDGHIKTLEGEHLALVEKAQMAITHKSVSDCLCLSAEISALKVQLAMLNGLIRDSKTA